MPVDATRADASGLYDCAVALNSKCVNQKIFSGKRPRFSCAQPTPPSLSSPCFPFFFFLLVSDVRAACLTAALTNSFYTRGTPSTSSTRSRRASCRRSCGRGTLAYACSTDRRRCARCVCWSVLLDHLLGLRVSLQRQQPGLEQHMRIGSWLWHRVRQLRRVVLAACLCLDPQLVRRRPYNFQGEFSLNFLPQSCSQCDAIHPSAATGSGGCCTNLSSDASGKLTQPLHGGIVPTQLMQERTRAPAEGQGPLRQGQAEAAGAGANTGMYD